MSEAGRAKIEGLKRAVGAAEEFLKTEESYRTDHGLLKKLKILERTLGSTVEKMENLHTRLQLAPAELEELEGWLARGHNAVSEIASREFKCSPIPPSPQGNFNQSTGTKLKFKDIVPSRFGRDPREYLTWKTQTKRLISSFNMTGEMAMIFLLENCLEQTISVDLKKIYTDRMNSIEDMFRLLDQDYFNP